MTTSLLWLRRDLRRKDHPALLDAAAGATVLPVYIIDPDEVATMGPARRGWLAATLLATSDLFQGRLCVRMGDPAELLPPLALAVGARTVHVSTETTPRGWERDGRVCDALANAGIVLAETGSPYAVTPGRIRTGSGRGYRVFGAFERAWRAHGWPAPPGAPAELRLLEAPRPADLRAREYYPWIAREVREMLENWRAACPVPLPDAGEAAAHRAWAEFRSERLDRYSDDRDRVDLPSTSRLSPYLALGVIHPRTLLADLAGHESPGVAKFVSELAWREFYADVLRHQPDSLTADLLPSLAGMMQNEPDDRFDAWREGRTGFPLVDAGMRQLRAEGWLPNRVRMVVASFLVKDLHLPWQLGAQHFRELLIDYDAASNAHNWQWVAGTGTDAAPYFRVFNPDTQAATADPDGRYVRFHVPELAHLPEPAALRPWKHPDCYTCGCPERILDHAEERIEALTRYRFAVDQRGR